MYSCICPSYSRVIYCYTLRNGNNVRVAKSGQVGGFGTYGVATSGACRALTGIDESPFYAIAYENKIEVHSILRLYDPATTTPVVDGHNTQIASRDASGKFIPVASYNEEWDGGAGNFPKSPTFKGGISKFLDDQIRDMVYINTHPYAAGSGTYGSSKINFNTFRRKYNTRGGPNNDNDIPVSNNLKITKIAETTKAGHPNCPKILDPTDNSKNCFNKAQNGYWGTYQDSKTTDPFLVNPRERIFFVTNDYGKVFWWADHTADGLGSNVLPNGPSTPGYNHFCHPFCLSCRFPFNYRWCTDRDTKTGGDATPICRQRDGWKTSVPHKENFIHSLSHSPNTLTPPGVKSGEKPRSEFIIPGPLTSYSFFSDTDKLFDRPRDLVRIPPECYPFGYPRNDLYHDSNHFHNLWKANHQGTYYYNTYYPITMSGKRVSVPKPWSTRPLLVNPPSTDPEVHHHKPSKGYKPLFVAVLFKQVNGTYDSGPSRGPGGNWWKLFVLILLGMLFVGLVGLGLWLPGPMERVSRVEAIVTEEKRPLIIKEEIQIIKSKKRPRGIDSSYNRGPRTQQLSTML